MYRLTYLVAIGFTVLLCGCKKDSSPTPDAPSLKQPEGVALTEAERDIQRAQGTWALNSIVRNGIATDAGDGNVVAFTVTGYEISAVLPHDKRASVTTVDVETDQVPKRARFFGYSIAGAPGAPLRFALYEITSDTIKLCMFETPRCFQEVPDRLESGPGIDFSTFRRTGAGKNLSRAELDSRRPMPPTEYLLALEIAHNHRVHRFTVVKPGASFDYSLESPEPNHPKTPTWVARTSGALWITSVNNSPVESNGSRVSHVVPGDDTYTEFYDVSTRITPTGLTAADRLNGIEWIGVVAYQASASRTCNAGAPKPSWTEWQTPASPTFYTVNVTKRAGLWKGDAYGARGNAPNPAYFPQGVSIVPHGR